MVAERAKAKQLKQQAALTKRSVKKKVNFEEEPPSQPNQIFITHQQLAPEQERKETEQDFNELEGPDEGIFLCPECTCWFTNKKDLNFHKRHWCGR